LFKEQALDYFSKGAFKEIKKRRSYIWIVYLVFNPVLERRVRKSRALIVGAFYGIINSPKLKGLELTLFAD